MDEMATRGLATKDLLGDPDSVLDAKWLEAYHAGDEYSHMLPWDFKNRPQLPTKRQVIQNIQINSHFTYFSKPKLTLGFASLLLPSVSKQEDWETGEYHSCFSGSKEALGYVGDLDCHRYKSQEEDGYTGSGLSVSQEG